MACDVGWPQGKILQMAEKEIDLRSIGDEGNTAFSFNEEWNKEFSL
jgi:hypothetical protein